ncbi:hypothetical protein F6V25_11375 [Oryzomonas japonica]|uniref:Uncharacterized protein n=1 Tax=Oryzomonas japonica TaxID=2603858 RepID=A0A7J4ZP31_9BACT|nr:hypothetical protein [Oryzomonas japonica]KAB0664664.1 hypothetical protein F6V25_11375 [Oryzomonas japonica]
MGIVVKASDLKFKYPKDLQNREEPKFSGIPDPTPFNRDDLYDILPMMEAVMDALESSDGQVLHLLEDILNEMPRFFVTREEVYACLLETARERHT